MVVGYWCIAAGRMSRLADTALDRRSPGLADLPLEIEKTRSSKMYTPLVLVARRLQAHQAIIPTAVSTSAVGPELSETRSLASLPARLTTRVETSKTCWHRVDGLAAVETLRHASLTVAVRTVCLLGLRPAVWGAERWLYICWHPVRGHVGGRGYLEACNWGT